MTSEAKQVIISWEAVEWAILQIIPQLSILPNPIRKVVAIMRGGLIPAHLIARQLEAELVLVDNTGQLTSDLNRPNVLIVDDIYDSGRTCKIIEKCLPQAKYAFCFSKHEDIPHIVGTTVLNDKSWFVFPWEKWDAKVENALTHTFKSPSDPIVLDVHDISLKMESKYE